MVTSILKAPLLQSNGGLEKKLESFAQLLEKDASIASRKITKKLQDYRTLSAKQTTDVSRRDERERLFLELIELV